MKDSDYNVSPVNIPDEVANKIVADIVESGQVGQFSRAHVASTISKVSRPGCTLLTITILIEDMVSQDVANEDTLDPEAS